MILGSVDDGASAALVAGLAEMLVGSDADARCSRRTDGRARAPAATGRRRPGNVSQEMGYDDQSPVSDEEFIRDSSSQSRQVARADDGFLGAQLGGVDRAFDQMPNHPLRDQVREMLRTSAANARSAAVDVLGGAGTGGGSNRCPPRTN